MAKDPVLPLYYNDITSSTVDWSDEEFGAYMRLLIYQWDKGSIPESMGRLKRISDSAEKNWAILSQKFPKKDSVLMNEKMEEIRNEREKFRAKQKENAARRHQKSAKPLPTDMPTNEPDGNQTDIQEPAKILPLEVEVEIEEEVKVELEDEVLGGGKNFEPCLNDEMMNVFLEFIPEYGPMKELDDEPLLKISDYICLQEKIRSDPATDQKAKTKVLMIWRMLCIGLAKNKFYKTKSLKTIANHIQGIASTIKNEKSNNNFSGESIDAKVDKLYS